MFKTFLLNIYQHNMGEVQGGRKKEYETQRS